MFYWLNLPTGVRYNLCNMKLIAVAKSEYLDSQNISYLLQNFIEISNKLSSNGLYLTIKNQLRTVFGLIRAG